MKIRDDGTIYIPEVRLLFPHLETAWARNEGERKKFSVLAMLPKERRDDAKTLYAHIQEVLQQNKCGKLPPERLFFRDGGDSGRAACEGTWLISASESAKPKCIDSRKKPIGGAEFFSGCWANVLVRPWFQNNKFGKRVNANLLAVQFLRSDDPIGRSEVDVDEVFDSIGEEFGGSDDLDDDTPF